MGIVASLLFLGVAALPMYASAQQSAKADLVRERVTCEASLCTGPVMVFIHGIWGSRSTWLNPLTGKTWPQLVLEDRNFKDFDVYRLDYESKFFALGPQPKGSDIGRAVFEVLRPTLARYSKVYLIGHSMGGNLIRHYLVLLKASTPGPPAGPGHKVLEPYTHGIFFLGTPVEGARIAEIGKHLNPDPALRALLPIDVNDYLTFLNDAWGRADHCDQDAPIGVVCRTVLTLGKALRVYAVCEEKPFAVSGLPTPILVVSRDSATALDPLEAKCFNRDHSTLVKPKDTTDPVYDWVKVRVLGLPRQ